MDEDLQYIFDKPFTEAEQIILVKREITAYLLLEKRLLTFGKLQFLSTLGTTKIGITSAIFTVPTAKSTVDGTYRYIISLLRFTLLKFKNIYRISNRHYRGYYDTFSGVL